VLHAIEQHQHLVTDRQHRSVMCDQDDNGAARLGITSRLEQCHFPVAIEIGVRLIEDDQKRIAGVACSREILDTPMLNPSPAVRERTKPLNQTTEANSALSRPRDTAIARKGTRHRPCPNITAAIEEGPPPDRSTRCCLC